MKISIVTVTLHEPESLRNALASVAAQGYADLEHIVVDGGGDPATARVVAGFESVRHVVTPPRGVYDALNRGFQLASGDILGLIHSNDALPSDKVLDSIAAEFQRDPDLEFIYGDMRYVRPGNRRHVRIYYAGGFTPVQLTGGMAPPHPTLYIRRNTYLKMGSYRLDMPNAADFEMWVRLFSNRQLKYKYLPMILAEMTTGGRSSKPAARLFTNNREKLAALRLHNLPARPWRLAFKYFTILKTAFFGPKYEH